MNWSEYNILIQPLILKFGAHKYNSAYISDQFFFWKSKDKSELLELVNECISFNQQLDLKPKQSQESKSSGSSVHVNNTQSYIQSMSDLKITDGYLQNLLNSNGCSSLLELVEKQKIK
jgi:hypothetical protein